MPNIGTQTRMSFKSRSRRVFRKKKMPLTRAQARAVKKIASNSGELKEKQLTITTASVGSGLNFAIGTALTANFAIAQGTDDDERIGDSLRIKDLCYKFNLTAGSTGGNTEPVRVVLYQCLDNVVTALLADTFSFWPNRQTADRSYKKLYDRIVYPIDGQNNESKFFDICIKGKKLVQVEFDDAATTISRGEIIMQIIPMNTGANVLKIEGLGRLRYHDS